jgi:D-xylose 1-dehydrogenase (NADP+, D-xylono-1,5-lactone-forming)
MSAPLRWGVLGARSMIYRNAILPAIGRSKGRHTVARAESQGAYEAVVSDPSVDAVYIPLPNGMHLEWIERCAAAGKHVLCEKPLGCKESEAQAAIDACTAAGVTLVEAYMTPHHPRAAAVVDLARSGALGSLRTAHAAFTFPHPNPQDHRFDPRLGGGALLDVGIYVLAPLLAITGRRPDRVYASATANDHGVDVSISARLEWDGDFAASVECSFDAPERQTFEIFGTQAGIDVRDKAYTPGPKDDRFEVLRRDGSRDRIKPGGGDLYLLMLDRFAGVLRGDATPVHTLDDTIRVASTIDRIRAAAGLSPVGV